MTNQPQGYSVAAELRRTATPVASLLKPGELTTRMKFPRELFVVIDQRGTRVWFPAGEYDVPRHMATHPYLADNGATRVDPDPA